MVLEGHIFSVSSVLHEVWSIVCAWNCCSKLFLVKYTDYQLSMIDMFLLLKCMSASCMPFSCF